MYSFNNIKDITANIHNCPICNCKLSTESSYSSLSKYNFTNDTLYFTIGFKSNNTSKISLVLENNTFIIDSEMDELSISEILSEIRPKLQCPQRHYSIEFLIELDFTTHKISSIQITFEDIDYCSKSFITDFIKEKTSLIYNDGIEIIPFFPLIDYANSLARLDLLLMVS